MAPRRPLLALALWAAAPLAGRHLLVLGESSGELRIVDADPAAYRERGRVVEP